MDKVKLFIASTRNKINNIIDKIVGAFASKKDKNHFIQESLDRKLVLSLSKSRFPNFKQIQKLPQFLSKKEKRTIKIFSSLILVCTIFLSGSFYINHVKIVPTQAGDYIEGVIGAPQYINPLFSQVNDTDADLVKLIFSGLLKLDINTNELQPDLAERYEISEDKKSYTFYLKENLQWQDGEPLTIDDIIFTVALAKFKETKSPLSANFAGINVEKIDDRTIKFILPEPFDQFLSNMTFGILPKHIWEDVNLANINLAEYNLKPIGSGPYRVESRIIDTKGDIKSYLLTANDKYYAEQPFIKNITLKFFPNYEEAVNELKIRTIQGLSFIPSEMEQDLSGKEHLNNYDLPLPQFIALFFNQDYQPLLKEKSLREALTLAINKKELIANTVGEKNKIVSGPFIDKNWLNEDLEDNAFDPAKSIGLIENLKFIKEDGDDFFKKEIKNEDENSDEKKYEDLTISIVSVNSVRNSMILEEIKKYWEKIGVKTEINLIDPSQIKQRLESRDYDVLLYGESVSFTSDPYPFWHSSQAKAGGLNLSGFNNKKADTLLEEARATIDVEIKKQKYTDFQKILNEEKPAIFLYQPIYSYMIDKNIKGVVISNINRPADRFSNIEDWYIKTKREFSW